MGPNFGVHHSNTENSMWKILWLSVRKCLETGVFLDGFGFRIEFLFINSFSEFMAGFPNILARSASNQVHNIVDFTGDSSW